MDTLTYEKRREEADDRDKSMKTLFKSGDIVKNQWDEIRIILHTSNKNCYYIDHNHFYDLQGYFYNPCRACVSETAMKKYRKIGEIPKETMDGLQHHLLKVIQLHNKAFELCNSLINGNNTYDLKNFIT